MRRPLLAVIAAATSLALVLALALRGPAPGPEIDGSDRDDEASLRRPADLERPEDEPLREEELSHEPERTQRVPHVAPSPAPRHFTLSCRVVDDRTNEPVSGATVRFTEHDPRGRPGQPPGATRVLTTGPAGEFSVPGVEPCRWSATIDAPWRPTETVSGVAERDAVPTTQILRLKSPPIFFVRLLDDRGAPLSRALRSGSVVLPRDVVLVESREPVGERRGPDEGRRTRGIGADRRTLMGYSESWQDGLAHVEAAKSAWFAERSDPDELDTPWVLPEALPSHLALCSGPLVLGEALVDGSSRVVELVVPPARVPKETTVCLRVVDAETGSAISAARASLLEPGKFGPASWSSDAEGVVRIEGWNHGPRWLTVLATGYEWIQREVVVSETAHEANLGTFELTRATRVRGRLVGPACEGVEVLAFPLERFQATRELRRSFAQRPDAPSYSFEFRGLGRGRHLLRLEGRDAAGLPVVVDASHGDVDGVELVCERGTEVLFERAAGRAAGLLCVATADGLPVLERELAGARDLAVRLVPGAYTWRIDGPGSRSTARTLAVGTRDLVVAVPEELGR